MWLETGNEKSGLEHILLRHESEFLKIGITTDKLVDVAKAATTVG